MDKLVTAPAPPTAPVADDAVLDEEELIEEDLLVEDVSIDGMCGVY
jgi:mycofactocin precursor